MGDVILLKPQHPDTTSRQVCDRRTPHTANAYDDDVIHLHGQLLALSPRGMPLYLADGRAIAIDHQDALGRRRLRFWHVDLRSPKGAMGKGQLRHTTRLDPTLYPFPT